MARLKDQQAAIAKKKKLLNTEDAATFLGYTIHALKKWRHDGRGPAFYKGKGGMVFYDVKDLKAFKPKIELHRIEPAAAKASA